MPARREGGGSSDVWEGGQGRSIAQLLRPERVGEIHPEEVRCGSGRDGCVHRVINAPTSCHRRELGAQFPFLQQRLCAVTVAFLAPAPAVTAVTAGSALSLSV